MKILHLTVLALMVAYLVAATVQKTKNLKTKTKTNKKNTKSNERNKQSSEQQKKSNYRAFGGSYKKGMKQFPGMRIISNRIIVKQ